MIPPIRVEPNSPTNRLILLDDGMSGDEGMLDGLYSGVLEGLPNGAEVQFYLESMDVSELTVTTPGNTTFAQPGQPVTLQMAPRSTDVHSITFGPTRGTNQNAPAEYNDQLARTQTHNREFQPTLSAGTRVWNACPAGLSGALTTMGRP